MTRSQAMTRWLSIPDVLGEGYGSALVFFCIPDTRGWRGNATKAVRSLAYGRNYNEEDGSVRDVVAIGKEVFNSMTICSFDEIIAAIQSIQPVTNVTVYAGGGSSCGCAGPSEPISEPGTQGDPPPDGWEPVTDSAGDPLDENDPAYQNRKCAMSWAIQTQIEGLLQKMIDSGWDDTLAAFQDGGFAVAGLMIGYMIGELSTPFPILDGLVGAVIGWLANLVIKLVVGDVDIVALNQAVVDNRDELVCALYQSQSALDAIGSYELVLDSHGVTLANQEVILAILTNDVVNLIFFKNSKLSQSLEQAVLNEVWPSCDGCCALYWVNIGTLVEDAMPAYIEMTTVVTDNFVCDFGFVNSSRAAISFVSELPLDPCAMLGENECFSNRTVTAIRFVGGAFTQLGSECHAYINHIGGQTCHFGFPGADWEGSISDVKSIGVAGNASGTFTVRVEFE